MSFLKKKCVTAKLVIFKSAYRIYCKYFRSIKAFKSIAKLMVKLRIFSSETIKNIAEQKDISIKDTEITSKEPKSQISPQELQEDNVVNNGFHLSPPLNIEIDDSLSIKSTINIILPSLRLEHMSGGPNTALIFAAMLSEKRERIRLIASDADFDTSESEKTLDHIEKLVNRKIDRSFFELVNGFDRQVPIYIGMNDIFFATAWWTAQMASYAIKKTVHEKFIYLIQDFEPVLHNASTLQARANETYNFSHIPVVNTQLLLDYFIANQIGKFADPKFCNSALSFEPALDKSYFYPEKNLEKASKRKQLLFYARPTSAHRNLFEMGLEALINVVSSGLLDKDQWDIWAVGEKINSTYLGRGVYLHPLPWMEYSEYAKKVRTADLFLSLMLSPHPSYPPLEMAASGNFAITNSYSVKTESYLNEYSPNLIVAKPETESVTNALALAISKINANLLPPDISGKINLPLNWDQSLYNVIDTLSEYICELRNSPKKEIYYDGYPIYPTSAYELYRKKCRAIRREKNIYRQQKGLITFITSTYNTHPNFLLELNNSIFVQDGGVNFDWLILDNGSTDTETISTLKSISSQNHVKLIRVEENLGIIGGMSYLLNNAQGRYIIPLDSDDILEPDCVNTLTRYILENDYPALLYTDEDKLKMGSFVDYYFKPDWDPVLFSNSCYIAHLCVINRELALELNCYSDKNSEGCHDWDTFTRFMNANCTPVHISEVLYSWRMHENSTSGNVYSKNYLEKSHFNVLNKIIDHKKLSHLSVTHSTLFKHNIDWKFVNNTNNKNIKCDHLNVNSNFELITLAEHIKLSNSKFLHILWDDVIPDNNDWISEASVIKDLFPDTVMIGGTIHCDNKVLGGPMVFGFEAAVACPDKGRLIDDPGYMAQMFKSRSVSCVSGAHCILDIDFLKKIMPILIRHNVTIEMLSIWVGGLAIEYKKRIVFSPFMKAESGFIPEENTLQQDISYFISRFWKNFPDNRYYSQHLGLRFETAYTPVSRESNQKVLDELKNQKLIYREWLKLRLKDRHAEYSSYKSNISIDIVTTIYANTNLELFIELANSISSQSFYNYKWIIVAHGDVSKELLEYIKNLELAIVLVIESKPLEIIEAMNIALNNCSNDYFIPIDSDDLITSDALAVITFFIKKYNYPDLVYSDEDLIDDNGVKFPYLRGDFDSVLNGESSYIWHLCAINRKTAIDLGIYLDIDATWCHDWNTITKFMYANKRIEHIPEILYHWRQHDDSTTNNSEGSSHSLNSVKFILDRRIKQCDNPKLFYVAEWPIFRGSKELYIARKSNHLPKFILAQELNKSDLESDSQSIIISIANGVTIDDKTKLEVVRLFELYPQLGAVGGIVKNSKNYIVDSCHTISRDGFIESPWEGHLEGYLGDYSLANKPQTVFSTGKTLSFYRSSTLLELSNRNSINFSDLLSEHDFISVALNLTDWKIAFSPLIVGKANCEYYHLKKEYPHRLNNIKINNIMSRYNYLKEFK
ncbi:MULTISPECIES: rhamnosyltransferase WsaF family glycosyltransferase [Francisella]|uniref:Glycosyltransferase n=2 Tax=Francisella TaxID=262 RepID=A0AAJ4NP78_9GAMM|nr:MULTISPECIES: glycosyltransferase [Francisella]QEO57918.1 glycosyltransferase [Francisella marina]QWU99350.1 glycosyltransferase [Francisella salimarina]